MPISRLLPAVVAVAMVSLCQYANAQTPLPQFYDSNFQACLTEQAARNGWTSAENVTALACPNRGITMLGGVQQLMNLTDLDLSGNALRGVYEVGMLPNINRLNLAGNTGIPVADLRNLLQRLPALRSLNLNGINIGSINNLDGLMNTTPWQPKPLVELDLGSTHLQDQNSGKTLDFLRNFSTLKKLNVSDNGITGADGIATVSDIEELDLSNNSLPYLGMLQQLTHLKRLNLAGNKQLSVQEIAMLISRNPGLTSINLNGIVIGNISNLGPLVDSRTGQPLNLTELDLGNTGVFESNGAGTLNFLRPFVNLRKLNVANNSIRDTMAITAMQQLEELDLSGNQLAFVGPLGQLHNLTRLNLSGNRSLRFDEIANMLLANNPKLSSIGLNGIRIGQNTQWLNNIMANPVQAGGMLELDLGNTALASSVTTSLRAFPNLLRLNLAGNNFSLDTDFGALPELRKLQDLDLSGNGFRDSFFLTGLSTLRRLNISNTQVRREDLRSVIASVPNLRSLGLNGITIGRMSDWFDLRNSQTGQPLDLLELDLGNTALQGTNGQSGFDFLRQFPNLQRLNLAGNAIEDIWEYREMPLLRDLDLSGNRLRALVPGAFGNLNRINLSGNTALDINTISGSLSQAPGLTSLGLNGIAIGNVSNLGPLSDNRTGRPYNLTELDLGNTGIKDAAGNATLMFLQPFVNMRALNVANNGISDIMPLSGMTGLQELDLSGNQVFSVGGLRPQHNLTRLNLSGNRALRMDEVATLLLANPGLNRLGLSGIRIAQNTQWLSTVGGTDGMASAMLELDLGNTAFDASALPLLARFTALERLSLANNGLPGESSLNFMTGLGKLQDLDLSGNAFRDFFSLGDMSNLRRLNLSNTALRKEDVRALLGQMPNLTSLSLNGVAIGNVSNLGDLRNRLTGQPYNLSELDLGNTGLDGTMGKRGYDFVRQFPNLKRLNLAGNGIEDFPEYGDLQNLADLDISSNRLQVLVPGSGTRLQRLIVSGNTRLRPMDISSLIYRNPDLTVLGLNGIAIGAINNLGPLTSSRTGRPLALVEVDFGNTGVLDQNGKKTANFLAPFTSLQRVNLAGNGMLEISVLGTFAKLRELDVSNNLIQDVFPLAGLRNLTRLNLSGNGAINGAQLRPVLEQSVNLSSLGLNGIELRDFAAIGGLQNPQTGRPLNIEELDLGNTRLSANGNTGASWLAMFPNLQRLNLAGNGLDNVRGAETLLLVRELDLSGNNLQDVTPLSGMRNLKRLNLSGNAPLQSWGIAPLLRQNSGLTALSLNGINLGSLSSVSGFYSNFGPLPLTELDIGNTRLQDIDGLNFLVNFPGITRLNLAGNGLRSFNGVRNVPALLNLDVSNNNMTVLFDVAIRTLQTLNLAGNTGLACAELDQFVTMMNTTVVTRPATCLSLNQPPVAAAGADQTVGDSANVVLSGSGVDSDGTISTYAWQQLAGPSVALGSPFSAVTGFTAPVVTSPTVLSFQLKVVDNKGASATSTTNVTVKPAVNVPPVASAGANQNVSVGASVVLAGSATDSDGTIASYDWVQTAGPAVVLSTPKAAISGFVAPTVATDTVLSFQLSVKDNKGASATSTTNVTVKVTPNLPPLANAGSAQTVPGGATVTLAGSGSDPDGNIAGYFWSQTAGTAVVLANSRSAGTTFVAPLVSVPTVFTFQLKVQDDRGASAISSVSITVNPKPNAAPVANAGATQSVTEGSSVTLAGSGTDSDGTIASYKWVQTSGPAVTLTTPNAATTTFIAPQVSIDTPLGFTLTVIDNKGAAATASTGVLVKDAADLTVSDIYLMTSYTTPSRGQTIPLTVYTRNAGNQATTAASQTAVYLTQYPGSVSPLNGSTFLSTVQIPSGLAKNSIYTSSISVTIPVNLAPGVYYVAAIADSSGKVAESSESNNSFVGRQITVY